MHRPSAAVRAWSNECRLERVEPRHGLRARELRGDQRTGNSAPAHCFDERQPPQQPVPNSRRECVAGSEPVDDVDRKPGNVGLVAILVHGRAPLPAFQYEQYERGNIAQPRSIDFLLVADHDIGGSDRIRDERRVLLRAMPEGRPPVEIENSRAAMRLECGERRLAARRLRKPGSRCVEKRSAGNLFEVEVFERKLPVGRRRTAVERERETAQPPDLAERRRSQPVRVRAQEADVDRVGGEPFADELAMTVVPDAGDDRRAHTEPGKSCRDVSGEPADEARVGTHFRQRRLELVGVQVDPDPAQHRSLDHKWLRSSCLAVSYCSRAARTDAASDTSATGTFHQLSYLGTLSYRSTST